MNPFTDIRHSLDWVCPYCDRSLGLVWLDRGWDEPPHREDSRQRAQREFRAVVYQHLAPHIEDTTVRDA